MLFILAYTYIFYLVFILCMAIKAVWGGLALGIKIILAPLGAIGVIMDAVFQAAATLPFLDLPREWMFTQRCNRYIKQKTTKRSMVARWICKYFLDPFQVGGHCYYGN